MEPDKKNDSKFFFKIGELVEITGIPSSKIRYWTKKYKELSSQLRTNDETSHKLYHKNSIEIILEIDKYMKNLEILSNNENMKFYVSSQEGGNILFSGDGDGEPAKYTALNAPSNVSENQLKELNISIKNKK